MLDFGALHGALTLMGATYPPLKAKGCLLVALLVRHDASSLVRSCHLWAVWLSFSNYHHPAYAPNPVILLRGIVREGRAPVLGTY